MTDYPMVKCEKCGVSSFPVSAMPDGGDGRGGPAACPECHHKPAIPLDADGLPDIRAMGCKKKPGRHNIGMSAKAATGYLDLKLRLLELDSVLVSQLSDSAMVELLVHCANNGLKATQVLFSGWRPETKDFRRAENIPVENIDPNKALGPDRPRDKRNVKHRTERIQDTINRRKEVTHERLQFFRAYPAAARARKRALCKRARIKDLAERDPVRRRDG